MRVLYLHPQAVADRGDFAFLPVGVVGVLNHLRARGIEVAGINCALERHLDPEFKLEDALSDMTFDAALVGLHWYVHADGALRAARTLKEVAGRPVLMGGYTASHFWRELLEQEPAVHGVVFGDCEGFLPDALAAVVSGDEARCAKVPNLAYRDAGGTPVRTGMRPSPVPIDELDYVDLSFLRHGEEQLGLTEGEVVPGEHGSRQGERLFFLPVHRGCSRSCPCCGGSASANARLAAREGEAWRSPQIVAEDFHRLGERGIDHVRFSAPMQERFWSDLMVLLEDAPSIPRATFECWDLPSVDLVQKILTIFPGAAFVFTPLSGDEQVRRMNGKGGSNDDVLAVARAVANAGGHQIHYFFPNLVGGTIGNFAATIELGHTILDATPPDRTMVACGIMEMDIGSDAFVDPAATGALYYRWSFDDVRAVTALGRLSNMTFTSRKMGLDAIEEALQAWRQELCEHQGYENAILAVRLEPAPP